MRVLIAVPCFNEELSIEECIENIRTATKNLNTDICIFNDGSDDSTPEILEKCKDIIVLNSKQNIGLSKVFNNIVHFANENSYDYLIIYEADNQYPHQEIENFLDFAIKNNFDISIGIRNFDKNKIFTKSKNLIQKFGSLFISLVLGIKVLDVTSGFRIYSSKSLENIYSTNSFSYTIETLFFAKKNKLSIGQFNLISFNKTRDSRLFSSNFEYINKTFKILLTSVLLFKNNILFYFYVAMITPGIVLSSRFLKDYFTDPNYNGHVQSLIVGMAIFVIATLIYISLVIISLTKNN